MTDKKISIIIPFMYNGDRFPLFNASIDNLYNLVKDLNVEIIVHEKGKEQKLPQEFIDKYNIKYTFSHWDEVFHRAWIINHAVRHVATGEIMVFFDADLIVGKEWVEELLTKNDKPYMAWGKIYALTKPATDVYLNEKRIVNDFERIFKGPEMSVAAGGITVIPKAIMEEVNGMPEDFRGTWGGEDNAFMFKLHSYGYTPDKYTSTVIHLHHDHATPRNNAAKDKVMFGMMKWSKKQWEDHNEKSKNWGNV